jgi:hypothetical protein
MSFPTDPCFSDKSVFLLVASCFLLPAAFQLTRRDESSDVLVRNVNDGSMASGKLPYQKAIEEDFSCLVLKRQLGLLDWRRSAPLTGRLSGGSVIKSDGIQPPSNWQQ